MNKAVFDKTMENVRDTGDLKLKTNQERRNYLVSEQNNHTTEKFWGNFLAIEMNRSQILIDKAVYLELLIS